MLHAVTICEFDFMKNPTDNLQNLRPAARNLDDSKIVEIMKLAQQMDDVVPLWVGEGDLPTPEFIISAANKSLADGETFYTNQRGIPSLREALASYHERVYGKTFSADRFLITGSGMQAIQISLQALAGEGDEVVMMTPCWPNIHAATHVAGGKPVHVELDFSNNGWSLDMQKLEDAIGPKTRAIFLNSPSNPTGWVADKQTLLDVLEISRKHNIWIVADEVYHRFYYEGDRSPSFYDLIEEDDRVIFVNTFSKNWAMTGWRAGWISAPPVLGQVLENLIQYSTSGVAQFTQRAAVVAVNEGEEFIAFQKERARSNLDLVCDALNATGKIELARPAGAFYLFFKIEGTTDSPALAKQILQETGVGMSPGAGFYSGGNEFLRMCFLRDPKQIEKAIERLVPWLDKL